MSNPLVSVVMAVRNGERFLASAIESVLAQDYRPLEIVLVDGQSTDRTPQIARSFDLVRYVYQTGTGVADAYNLGVASAQGDFIAFLSCDDLWTPDKLSTQMEAMLADPSLEFTVARVRFFLEPGSSIPPGFRKELLEGDHVGVIMETLVARRAVFDKVGEFDPSMPIGNDVDWFARARDMGVHSAVIPKVLLHKRIHDTNLSLSGPANNQDLMRALRASILRKRMQRQG